MRGDDSDFSGIAGRMVEHALAPGAIASGAMLGVPIIAGSGVLIAVGAPRLVLPFALVAMSAALARLALNGMTGERNGSLASDAGGPWTLVGAVALRHLALTFVWYAPMSLLGAISGNASASAIARVFGGSGIVGALTLVALAVTAPVFLVVAVSVENVADAFSTEVWRSRFHGRRTELITLYAVHTGSWGLLALLALPLLALARAIGPRAAVGAAALASCVVLGVSVLLLGRLCGIFASTAAIVARDAKQPAERAAEPTPAPTPTPTPVPSLAAPSTPSTPASAEPGRRPALLAAKQRVEEALRGADQDADGALSRLRKLDADSAPHPLVLHALFMTALRAGRTREALQAAERAIPVCVERGQPAQAAEIFREMRAHRIEAPIGVEALLAIGQALVRMDDLGTAAKAFTSVVTGDPQHTRAIKGLLEVADHILHRKQNPGAAAKVYRLVLTTCPHTPLTDFARVGLEEAERLASTGSSI
jgi:hypothetical protein